MIVNREELVMDGLSAGRVLGPLAPYAAGFVVELVGRGYRPRSVSGRLELMAHLSRWLAEEGVKLGGLTVEMADRFLEVRRESAASLRSWRALDPLIGYLRGLGAIPQLAVLADSPVDRLVAEYCDYLLRERGLTAGSVGSLGAGGRTVPGRALRAAGGFAAAVVDERGDRVRGGAVRARGPLRRIGEDSHDRAAVAASVSASRRIDREAAGASGASCGGLAVEFLAAAVGHRACRAVAVSCDQATPVGRRDLAILVLLARLGLRAGEVARLCLEDIDWRAGEVMVHGKGSTSECLPLPREVGERLVSYLRQGRPPVEFREVFVSMHAPLRPLSPLAVTHVVATACKRAGVEPVHAHRLRHTLASELLRAGTPLAQIAPILRHASVATTAIYAKIDRDALSVLARPWPLAGGES